MRSKTIIFIAMLLLQLPMRAQDADYPTLAALTNLEIPAFDFVDMVDRLSRKNTDYTPPESPPQYELGDRERFTLSYGEDFDDKRVDMELRAQTDRVLVWVDESVDYPRWRAQALARSLEKNVLDPVQKRMQYAEPPGIDGDPRLHLALMNDPDDAFGGYFGRSDARPRKLDPYSNQRELVVVNLSHDDRYDFFDEIMVDFVAHEYMHALQHHSDFGEESWLDEALATFVAFHASKPFLSRGTGHIVADRFLETPNIGLTQWQAVDDRLTKYGAGFLFMMYLGERFGDDIARRILAEPANGWRSIEKVLPEFTDKSADEVFADWALANYFLDSRRGYGYRELDADLTPPQPVAGLNSFPATYKGELPQYATDYISVDVRGADKLFVRLFQEPEAQLFDAADSDAVAYAVSSDYGHARLTRAFTLDSSQRQIWLEYQIWYDLADDEEYAYVTLSPDGGNNWFTLRGNYTESSDIYDEYYAYGYTGAVSFWRRERIDISRYRSLKVLISFELVSDFAANYRGVAIDDVRIRAIDYHEDFESPDDSWTAEGWIRTDNRLPNNTWLQVVQDTGERIHVSRQLVAANGELTVDLLPGVSQALVAVSPVVPITSLPTAYELEAYLMNAAGEVMVVSRECSVTTTHPLNFRAAPNGRKIGLLPKGTAVDALDLQGDWFQVDYNGLTGWVHADYVTTAGNCPDRPPQNP